MSDVYTLYKQALVNDINNKMGVNYVDLKKSTLDDLETTYEDQLGEDKLRKLKDYYGID